MPRPLPHQVAPLASPARFKVWRWGRRTGKTRGGFIGAVLGHGPMVGGSPLRKGIAQGADGVWLAPDFPQARAIWREEIEPRFSGVEGAELHQQERLLRLEGGGSLEIRSAGAIDGIRGRKLGFVIIDEAAFMDLESAWKEVILPALLDLGGWAIIISTPNAGPDGHEDEAGKRSPSYFNILCEKIAAGEMASEWEHTHLTPHDNSKLEPEAIAALCAEYPADSPELAQEVYAKLIAAGSGVAFPEWNDAVHIARYEPTGMVRWSGGGDWGFRKYGVLHLIASMAERSLVRFEYRFKEQTPYQAGYTFGQMIISRFPLPEWIAVDTPAVSDGGPSILDELQRGMKDVCIKYDKSGSIPAFINPPKGPGSRLTKKILLHKALRYSRNPDGTVPSWALPALQVHPDCAYLASTLPKLPRDPKGKEDVDTAAEDHAYDSLTSWLMAGTPQIERDSADNRDPDHHPGFANGKRKDEGLSWQERFAVEQESGGRWSRLVEVE